MSKTGISMGNTGEDRTTESVCQSIRASEPWIATSGHDKERLSGAFKPWTARYWATKGLGGNELAIKCMDQGAGARRQDRSVDTE